MIDEARALYQVPPREFVAARNALAKELKASGRKDDAAEVVALRRPRMPEHGLNLVADADPDLVDSFATAVHAATTAQRRAIEHGEGGALRAATEDLRRASGALADAAIRALDAEGEKGEAQRMEILQLLRSVLSAPALEQMRTGVLGSAEVESDDEEDVEPAPRRATPATVPAKAKAGARKTEAKKSSPEPRGTTAAERREQAQAAKELATHRRKLERELEAAKGRVDAAAKASERARKAVRDAEKALVAAESTLAEAEADAERARAELDAL